MKNFYPRPRYLGKEIQITDKLENKVYQCMLKELELCIPHPLERDIVAKRVTKPVTQALLTAHNWWKSQAARYMPEDEDLFWKDVLTQLSPRRK